MTLPDRQIGIVEPEAHSPIGGCGLCADLPTMPDDQGCFHRCDGCGRWLQCSTYQVPQPSCRISYYSKGLQRRTRTGWLTRAQAEQRVITYATVMLHARIEEIGDDV